MTEKGLHTFLAEADFNDDLTKALSELVVDIHEYLVDNFIYDYKSYTSKDLRAIIHSLRSEIEGCIEMNAPGLSEKLDIIYRNGAWGCTLHIKGFLKLMVPPAVPWVVRLEGVDVNREVAVKNVRQCSVVRRSDDRYLDNLPRGSQMFVNHAHLAAAGRRLGKSATVASTIEGIITGVLCELGSGGSREGSSRYYEELPGISTIL